MDKEFYKLLIAILALAFCLYVWIIGLLYFVATPAFAEERAYEPVYTEHKADWSADYLWKELSKFSPNDKIAAGVMGYFWRESFFRSDAIAGWPVFDDIQQCDSSVEFTKTVDKGLHDRSSYEYYEHYISDIYGGYGLGQWLSPNYLNHFYEFVRERGGSIGDASLQCEFIFESMHRDEKLWTYLMEDETAFDCGMHIGTLYDGTCMAGTIAYYADMFYKEYAK